MPQLLSDRPPQLVRRPSLNDLVAALPTPLPCSRASFQRCLPCRTWKGFFRCSRLARVCPSVPIAIPVPCASMACSSLQNTTPHRTVALRQRFGQAGAPLQAQVLVLPRRAPPLVRDWWLALAARRASAIRGLHRCALLRHHQELRVGDVAGSWSTLRRRHSTRTRGSQPSWPSTAWGMAVSCVLVF